MEEVLLSATIDIPRIYTALAEWLFCTIFILLFQKKVKQTSFFVISILTLIVETCWLVVTDDVPVAFWIPCMFIAIGIMFLYLFFIMDTPLQLVAYTCMKAFLAAEFAASLEWQLEFYLLGGHGKRTFAGYAILLVVYGIVAIVIWLLENKIKKDEIELEITHKEILSTLLIVSSAFILSNLSFVYKDTPFSSTIAADIFTIRTLVDLSGLAILYSYQALRAEVSAEKEISKIQNMLTTQYDSYKNYQEVTDLINIKYHDLKHQIMALRNETNPEKRKEWIDHMEEELSVYQPERQTGNQILDGVIDGKMPQIRNNHITFTVVADGSLLNFMHVTDICSIFGNALDNAIENVIKVEDIEKRVIHMEISKRKRFVYAEVRNYCEEVIQIKNGFPVTTKKDSKNHGFGIKSISYTTKKYNGTVQFEVKDHFFSIRLLIPQE